MVPCYDRYMNELEIDSIIRSLRLSKNRFTDTPWDNGYNTAHLSITQKMANELLILDPNFDAEKFLTAVGY